MVRAAVRMATSGLRLSLYSEILKLKVACLQSAAKEGADLTDNSQTHNL